MLKRLTEIYTLYGKQKKRVLNFSDYSVLFTMYNTSRVSYICTTVHCNWVVKNSSEIHVRMHRAHFTITCKCIMLMLPRLERVFSRACTHEPHKQFYSYLRQLMIQNGSPVIKNSPDFANFSSNFYIDGI